ncbi:MAG: hypothetical protein ACRDA8_00025, partial [Shewanella sp.]
SGGQTTVNGIVVDGKTNSIGFQTNALALLDTSGNKALSWDAASGTFVFKGRLVVGGYAVNSEADIRALDGDTIYEKYQYSINGTSNWHDTLTTGDLYRRTATVTNGVVGTWSAAAKIAGNDGQKGDNGDAGQNGTNGTNGAGMYGGEFPAIDWTTTTANSRFQSKSGRAPVLNDVFTQTNSTTFETQARQYNGSTWANVAMFVDGSIVAKNTIAGDKIVAGTEITAPKIKGGELIGAKLSMIGTDFMKIEAPNGFGNEGLWYWFGVKKLLPNGEIDTSYPKKNNAKEWKDVLGNAFFGGELLIGEQMYTASNNVNVYSPNQVLITSTRVQTQGRTRRVNAEWDH